jgi:hypothetical protein
LGSIPLEKFTFFDTFNDFSLFLKILKNMAFIWQIGLYGKKYGKIQKIWHLPYLQGSAAALFHPPLFGRSFSHQILISLLLFVQMAYY